IRPTESNHLLNPGETKLQKTFSLVDRISMNGLVIPTDEHVREKALQIWSDRGGGNGFEQYAWIAAQDLPGIDLNYTCIAKHKLVDTNENWFGTIENRICRFCFRRAPAVTFRNEAHAVPEFLGNKALFSRD